MWEMLSFFLYAVREGSLGTRAASVAFHFSLAVIPFGLVLFVLTSYTPGLHIEDDLMPVISVLIPNALLVEFTHGIAAYENSSVTSLLSFGFLLAFYFASNGFSALIKMFSKSPLHAQKRKWWSIRLISLGCVLLFVVGIVLAFYLIVFLRMGLIAWSESNAFVARHFSSIYQLIDLLLLVALIYSGISLIYYTALEERTTFRFYSPGSTLATLLVAVTSLGYSTYIRYYANYNELYGALGTVLIVLLWVYLLSYALLIGFEWNAGIHRAAKQKTQGRSQGEKSR